MMKIRLTIILLTTLISACETQLDQCSLQLKQDPSLVNIGKILNPDNITVEMLGDTSYVAEGDKPGFTKWMLIEQRCLREEMERRSEKVRYPEQAAAYGAVMKFLNAKQDAYVELLAGRINYGTFYSSIRNIKNQVEAEVSGYEASLKGRLASQKASSSSSLFKPHCPPSKYPIYGCGNTSSSSKSSSRSPPGNKECTYKSGPYKWTKTISGFTCPATDSSGGYFGTLVR